MWAAPMTSVGGDVSHPPRSVCFGRWIVDSGGESAVSSEWPVAGHSRRTASAATREWSSSEAVTASAVAEEEAQDVQAR